MSEDYKKLLSDLDKKMKGFKGSACKHCRSTKKKVNSKSLCPACEESLSEKRKAALAKKRNHNAAGYVYVYAENGNSVLEHRLIMERLLGRKLQSHEVVLHKDGSKDNNAPENLLLGFRNGTPLQAIVCNHCGTIGEFSLNVPSHPPLIEEPSQVLRPGFFHQ